MIYNCMMFLNENDILEIKINNHWNIIDKFIILESSQTHTGDNKPYNFDQQRFKKYNDKIIYKQINNIDDIIRSNPNIVCPHLYQSITNSNRYTNGQSYNAVGDWIRDSAQAALLVDIAIDNGATDQDLLLMDCVDEIINTNNIEQIINRFDNTTYSIHGLENIDPIFGFEFINYYYKINLQNPQSRIIVQSMITTLRNLKLLKPSTFRHFGIQTHSPITNGGWHFGFLDGSDGEMCLQKFKSWAHSRDKDTNYYNNIKTKQDAVKRIFSNFNLEKVPISIETHPEYLINNLSRYTHLIYNND